MKSNRPLRDAFEHHRLRWGPRAAFHLARHSYGGDWRDRLTSWLWLIGERVPFDGSALPDYNVIAKTLNSADRPR